VAAVTSQDFEDHVYGIQLCFFEVLWTVERELTHIFGRVHEGRLRLHFTPELSAEREAVCDRLANDVVGVAFPGQRATSSFGAVPKEPGWHPLMSQDIFKVIAQERAPWRLEDGR
jgi:hypothetical protein